jgi:ATP-binding cassette, subfamily B (MDR/TAP), member 1
LSHQKSYQQQQKYSTQVTMTATQMLASMTSSASLRKIQKEKQSMMDFIALSQRDNMPLMANANGADQLLANFRWCGSGNEEGESGKDEDTKVSMWKLLSFSTCGEKWLMVLGLVMALLSGLGIPVWLALLASALDTFSNLGRLSSALPDNGDVFELLNQKLLQLSVAFMIVGGVVFVSGTLYVAIWTYTGEQQALRIQKAFVKAALKQDAAWFDTHNREELPTKMTTNIVYMSSAIGRSIADTFGLGVSALGCLVVALLLNTPLSLIMLAIIPVVVIIMLIFNYFIRKASKDANKNLGMAGSTATEVIAGIKTVTALCSKHHFRKKYEQHLGEAERLAIRGGVLQSALSGIVSMIFYLTYCYAFYVGTTQVQASSGWINLIKVIIERCLCLRSF